MGSLPEDVATQKPKDVVSPLENLISLDLSAESKEKLPKRIHTVVFDLDGTLIDNVKKFRTHFVVVAHRVFGVKRKGAALHFMENPDLPSREQIKTMAERIGWDSNLPIVRRAGDELYARCSRQKGKPTPYSVRTSEWLRAEGIRVVVCTGSREKDAEDKIFGTDLNKYVNAIVGSDSSLDGPTLSPGEPPVVKGDPQFMIAARKLGVSDKDYKEFKSGLYCVTDTPNDVLLFKASGVPCYGVADYATTRVKMIRAGADQVEPNLERLRSHIEGINFRAAVDGLI